MKAASNSTNPAERGTRPVALGRKNHLFVGSDWAAIRDGRSLFVDRNLQA
jgi:hypothetical protein